jgi:large subunit ribosomal protein L10
MDGPRPEKVAVVEEVRERLGSANAAVLTEYRGLSVADLAELRRSLSAAGGEYKVFKNTLVRRAVSGGPHEGIAQWLQGPTAIAFVSGEITAVAKTLRDYSRGNPNLVLKGGILGEGLLSASDIAALADLPSRDVMLARLAGLFAAPLQQFAGLLQALPRNLAYGLSALLDQQRSAGAAVESPGGGRAGGVEAGEAEGAEPASAGRGEDGAEGSATGG